MAAVIPRIPTEITVHLGAPNASAANVTVPFVSYIKNVASSEVYPTWEPSALRANILAITSFALNRVYTSTTAAGATPSISRPPPPTTRRMLKGAISLRTSPRSLTRPSIPISAAGALLSPWPPNSATARPQPATA